MVNRRCWELLLVRKASLEPSSSSVPLDLGKIERCELVVSSRGFEVNVAELPMTEPVYFISKTFLSSFRKFVSNLVQ